MTDMPFDTGFRAREDAAAHRTPDRGGSVAQWRSYARFAPFLRPYMRPLLLVLIISLASTGLTLAQPFLSKLLIDDALLPGDVSALVGVAVAMIAVTVGGFALNILASYRYVEVSAAILFDIRSVILRHLQTLSPRFYSGFRLGDIMSRLNGDVSTVQRVTADTVLSVLSNVLMLIGCVAFMVWLDWVLFLISIVLIPACILVFLHYQRILTAMTQDMRERGADIASMLVDTITGMRTVASLQAGEHEVKRFEQHNSGFVRALLRMQVASFMAGALPGTLLAVTTSAVILYGGLEVVRGDMTIGSLVAFMTYQMRLFGPIQTLMGLTSSLATTRVSLARIFELLDSEPEVRERDGALAFDGLRDRIVLEKVSMSHDGRPVLEDVSLEIRKGSFCAIVGKSGAGKSTMADLLVRNLDPDRGRILIDGRDIRDLRLADMRREIILADQSPYLFNTSIAANIGFATPDADRDAIKAAARLAGLEPMIARLPQGLDTPTGERGLKVSAGERQRIALARALLRRPSVLVLDEPTAALDSRIGETVIANLRKTLPDATIIAITHDPAVSRLAEKVLTLND